MGKFKWCNDHSHPALRVLRVATLFILLAVSREPGIRLMREFDGAAMKGSMVDFVVVVLTGSVVGKLVAAPVRRMCNRSRIKE